MKKRHILNGPAKEQFPRQFVGKSVKDSFELATTPDDLLYLPEKIKPMAGHVNLSQAIASQVESVLKQCAQLEK